MKKIILSLCLFFSFQAQAADYQVEFLPATNSVGANEVSSLPSSKISNFSSSVQLEFPAGMVSAFSLAACPSGWLKADGSAVSRVDKARLFSAMGTIHGQGNGSTTFNLPDYRGRFLRGADESTGRDVDASSRVAMNTGGNSGALVGSVQADAYRSHTHIQNAHGHNAYRTTSVSGGEYALNSSFSNLMSGDRGGTYATNSSSGNPFISNTTATNQASGGSETRPVNAYVIFCVKE